MNEFVDVIEPHYQLAICELYHPYFHGDLNDEDNTLKNYIYNSYLCTYAIEKEYLYDQTLYGTPWLMSRTRFCPTHPSIRNYNILKEYKLEIVQMIYLNTGHQLCIPKTFWLKIIQRKYKKYYKELQTRILLAKHPKALLRRQITGKRF